MSKNIIFSLGNILKHIGKCVEKEKNKTTEVKVEWKCGYEGTVEDKKLFRGRRLYTHIPGDTPGTPR